MMGTSSKFYSLIDRDSIYDSLFAYSSPASIYRVGRTCRLARWAVKDYVDRTFDINSHLKHFFVDPFGFRVVQAHTQAIVSGSSALQFFDRTFYPNSDLDIFVANKDAGEVCAWIVKSGGKGYIFDPTPKQAIKGILTPLLALRVHRRREHQASHMVNEQFSIWDFYDSNRYRAVLNFKATSGEGQNVQVIVTHNTPMECILSFHSTVVMNLISHAAAYSLYPKGTFEEGLMLPCDTREVNREPGIRKYLARGWKLAGSRSLATHGQDGNHSFVLGKRCVGDQSTWTIKFDDVDDVLAQTKVNVPKIDPITLNTFSLVDNYERGLPEMRFAVLKPSFFATRYTTCPESVPKMKFWLSLIEQMEDLAEDYYNVQQFTMWDMLLKKWNESLMRECTCLPGSEHFTFRLCPAFVSSFVNFGLLAKYRLSLISGADDQCVAKA